MMGPWTNLAVDMFKATSLAILVSQADFLFSIQKRAIAERALPRLLFRRDRRLFRLLLRDLAGRRRGLSRGCGWAWRRDDAGQEVQAVTSNRRPDASRRPERWFRSRRCTSTSAPLQVLRGVDLDVRPGEVVCVIGPSGSGKTTLLRCINFLETYQDGRILRRWQLVGYRERNGKLSPAPEREIARIRAETAMVFQQFNLFPHMTALRNVTFGPTKVRKISKSKAEKQRT